MSKYTDLEVLEDLRQKGAISEEEYQREKQKILNSNYIPDSQQLFGMDEKSYLVIMHLSQLAGFIVFGLGFAIPIAMWLSNNKNPNIDRHGKNIANFMISMIIYMIVSGVLCFVIIGIPMLIALAFLEIISIIIASVKASKGEYWKYPLTIPFFT